MAESRHSYFPGKTSREKALQKLKHFCGYQERSQTEVRQKLYSLGFFKAEAEELICRLIEEEYLNEERYARVFASSKARIRGWGKQKIRHELRQKGISTNCINLALKALDETEYIACFDRLAHKKWASLKDEKNIFVRKIKWQQFIIQKGYESAVIKSWSFPEQPDSGTASE